MTKPFTDENPDGLADAVNELIDQAVESSAEKSLAADQLLDIQENLVMLIRRLCRALEKKDPGNKVANQAMGYLQRKNLVNSSPLR